MAKSGLRRIISFGVGAITAALAIIGAYKAVKHAAKAVRRASEK